MTFKRNRTTVRKQEDKKTKWFIFDAEGKTLGRFASEVARVLRGKHQPDFTPHVDCGDGVIVINADKIRVTGAKRAQKVYRHYTGYQSGLREIPFEIMIARHPDRIINHAVRGMLPKTTLSRRQLRRLRVFAAGCEHDMDAQQPIKVNI